MLFLLHAAVSSILMGCCCWASNIWPGHETWQRAAGGRFLWWGLPAGAIVYFNDAPADHALWMTSAAWLGAWVPHAEMPRFDVHPVAMLGDVALVVVRVALMLAPMAWVFFICGADWTWMGVAAGLAVPCVLGGHWLNPHGVGLRTPRDLAGVLLGGQVGFLLTVAVFVPTPLPDMLVQ